MFAVRLGHPFQRRLVGHKLGPVLDDQVHAVDTAVTATHRVGLESGVLERRRYSQRPPRYEYTLTEKGTELCDVLLVLRRWGDKWLAGDEGPPVLNRHRACGKLGYAKL